MSKKAKKATYQQCRIAKGEREAVCWIPQEHAVLGKYLRIDSLGDGWKVAEVYRHLRTAQEVADHHGDTDKWVKKDHMDKIVLGDS